MSGYSRSQLSDAALLRTLQDRVAQDRATTAELLADLAEVDERKLYLPAGYPSMYAYCVGHLFMSEDVAYKRLQVARATRKFPELLEAIAEGRLHVSGTFMLCPYLGADSAADLIEAATHRSKTEIEHLLAERFPRPDMPTVLRTLDPTAFGNSPVPGRVGTLEILPGAPEPAPGQGTGQASTSPSPPVFAPSPTPRPRLTPLAPGRVALQVTITQETRELLRRAQELLGHTRESGEIPDVLNRALKLLVRALENRRFAECDRPNPKRERASRKARHMPAHVRREVWRRDGGRCTFVGENGHRCEERTRLEFDHVMPVAKGGTSTVANLRLRCRDHNAYEAARQFGERFMLGKRERAKRGAVDARVRKALRSRDGASAGPRPR
jgi:5-methylcytosine-specific restriction endonuclease McrA